MSRKLASENATPIGAELGERSFELRMTEVGIEMAKTLSRFISQQKNPNRLEPTREPQLDLVEKDEVKAKRPSLWNVVFYNDDYTPMDFVDIRPEDDISYIDVDALADLGRPYERQGDRGHLHL